MDTDVMIDYERGVQAARSWFASLPVAPKVPGFVAMELIQDAQNLSQVRQIEAILAPLVIVWPTESECANALSNFGRLNRSHGMGLIDALIAAMAAGRQESLFTFNDKHFRAYPGIRIEQPYTR